ncbi:hypothetical protein TREMEDRAFT_60523 [Tremella mesenterica DSM 1558]|uniref:uncharacterized protein n=1 Tax=Tremella mesenterica (strain ATCC 24925 / CBS 8224 / DSM 1558 / NBRC 9311 / NRRL Y-6157 / RJB 2259-6 / UBC 559-6) TaxID=578456 RepID=UPI0003F49BEE|nr:uncharacterized protein TREMEDRAFT_60523 [Tremella mesenterica DSM 1558]EIW71604.1 hypothetical protein TREMEDRAFT_60523 [Tremella mesenterica DSM 1558]
MIELGLPVPTGRFAAGGLASVLAEELGYDCTSLASEWETGLRLANEEQLCAMRVVTETATVGRGGVFFLDGPGGTGKTFVERLCLARVIYGNVSQWWSMVLGPRQLQRLSLKLHSGRRFGSCSCGPTCGFRRALQLP